MKRFGIALFALAMAGASQGHAGAFIYDHGTYTDVAAPGTPSGINSSDQIIGNEQIGFNSEYGYLYDHGQLTILKDPLWDGHGYTEVGAINDAGTIVGDYFNSDTSTGGAFIYSNGVYTPLAPPSGDRFLRPTGVNNHGDIVGTYFNPIGDITVAFLYKNGVFKTVNDVNGRDNYPVGINDSDDILGWYDTGTPTPGSAYEYKNGVYAGHLKYPFSTQPIGLSNDDSSLGNTYDKKVSFGVTVFDQIGFIYNNGTYTVIDDPAATAVCPRACETDTHVYGLNNLDQVVGVYSAEALLPEPATWAMMLMGLAGVGAATRGARRGRKAFA